MASDERTIGDLVKMLLSKDIEQIFACLQCMRLLDGDSLYRFVDALIDNAEDETKPIYNKRPVPDGRKVSPDESIRFFTGWFSCFKRIGHDEHGRHTKRMIYLDGIWLIQQLPEDKLHELAGILCLEEKEP